MTFADAIRAILGVILMGFGMIALAEEILLRRQVEKMTVEPHAWWYHYGTSLLIMSFFLAGAYLIYTGFIRPLVRSGGFTPVPEGE